MSLSSAVTRARGTMALFGPAFVAAIAYVDPGNVATNVTAGAVYGYLLVWVIVLANMMAGIVQYLSAKLGLAGGTTLPEALRDRLPTGGRFSFYVRAYRVTNPLLDDQRRPPACISDGRDSRNSGRASVRAPS